MARRRRAYQRQLHMPTISRPRITHSKLLSVMRRFNLYEMYPNMFKKTTSIQYLYSQLNNSCHHYQESMRQMICAFTTYTGPNPQNYIVEYSTINKTFYSHNMTDFKMTKFLEDFFKQPIETILTAFDSANFKNKLPNLIKINPELMHRASKICDMYLILKLANCLSFLHFLYEIKCIGLCQHIPTLEKCIKPMMSGLVRTDCNLGSQITHKYLTKKFPSSMKSFENAFGSKNNYIQMIKSLYELVKPMMYITDVDISNNIDFQSMYKSTNSNNIRFDCICHPTSNFFKFCILNGELSNKHILSRNFEPEFFMPELNIPDLNMDVKFEFDIDIDIDFDFNSVNLPVIDI